MALTRDTLEQLSRFLRPLQVRLANSIARAVVQLVDDSTKQQLVQLGVLAGEDVGDGEHFQAYGFSSVPLPGAEAVVLFPNGDRGHPLVVAIADRRHRPTGGAPGEVVVYNDTGARIDITKDGDIVLTPAPGRRVRLGSATSSDPPALKTDLNALKAAFATAAGAVVSGDGGAAALASLVTALSAWPVASSKVRAE
jgi:phage baseplate assembly protein V